VTTVASYIVSTHPMARHNTAALLACQENPSRMEPRECCFSMLCELEEIDAWCHRRRQ
jgi:hypothetical protein